MRPGQLREPDYNVDDVPMGSDPNQRERFLNHMSRISKRVVAGGATIDAPLTRLHELRASLPGREGENSVGNATPGHQVIRREDQTPEKQPQIITITAHNQKELDKAVKIETRGKAVISRTDRLIYQAVIVVE